MDPTLIGLRVLREVAERGSFTAAAATLGYTQSAVSRQIAALERTTGRPLFDRGPGGVRLTAAGRVLLTHAVVALDSLERAERELLGVTPEGGPVRLGMFISAGAVVVPRTLAALRRAHPGIAVTTREGTTPSLVRALRAGTLDVALLSSRQPYRPPDDESPALSVLTLAEGVPMLAVAVGSTLAGRDSVHLDELGEQTWIAGPGGSDPLFGVWPGLPGRPRIGHTARDWLTKLHLVAAGCGVTTVPTSLTAALPPGIRLLTVHGGPSERRRMVLAHLPGDRGPAVAELVRVLRREAARLV